MSISELQPLLPYDPGLKGKAGSIIKKAEDLGNVLHPKTVQAIASLLRTVNCYYSNLIEGHDTHPVDIEKAMRRDYSTNPRKRNLQEEALAHIEIQKKMDERLQVEPDLNVCSSDFLCWLHKEFYEKVPEELRFVEDPKSSLREKIHPGEIRTFDVQVGSHIAPSFTKVPEMLSSLGDFYRPSKFNQEEALIALSASHHRLLWVHPFGDGNGRVMRLSSDAYINRAGIAGHGLWTVSRGLARNKKKYLALLAGADAERWNDYDGRGNLSQKALTDFCDFFLDICADQIAYMHGLLQIDDLISRVRGYGEAREAGRLPGKSVTSDTFRPEETLLLEQLLLRGSIPRADVQRLLQKEERTARRIVSYLTDEGFIVSESSRAPLQFAIPAHAAPFFFPELYNPLRD